MPEARAIITLPVISEALCGLVSIVLAQERPGQYLPAPHSAWRGGGRLSPRGR